MYWEIVELDDGQIALRQVDDDKEPMVTIKFSPEARARLREKHIDVARAMFTAGMHVASNLDSLAYEEEHEDEFNESGTSVVH